MKGVVLIKYIKINIVLALFALVCAVPHVRSQPINDFGTLEDKASYYKSRYKAECVGDKITDNKGNGFDSLYGTRNMRTILFGVAYRGGANNFYHKSKKRDNHNPLPLDGLENLADEGFSKSVYLYGTNFADSRKIFTSTISGDTLQYVQNSGNARNELKKIMMDISEVIYNPNKGPIYLHCWNGWHQSGYVSSAILMQFCNFTNDQAFDYWMKNTDGVNKGYDNVKSKVKSFQPFNDISISDDIRKKICPCKD